MEWVKHRKALIKDEQVIEKRVEIHSCFVVLLTL